MEGMEDFEDIDVLEPAPGLAPVTSDGLHLNLNAQEKLYLVQWYGSHAYNVFIKLAQGEIEKAETRHFQQWGNKENFERTGLVAVATRMFFESLQREFNHQVEEFQGEVAFAKQTEELDRIKRDDPESLIQNM